MTDIGKFLVLCGGALAVLGAIVWALGRAGFRGLPGDISYQSQNVRFYFPILSCIVISILLTAGMWLWRWLSGR
jgi:uncharacterized membrane protein YidH (DUF202 family)